MKINLLEKSGLHFYGASHHSGGTTPKFAGWVEISDIKFSAHGSEYHIKGEGKNSLTVYAMVVEWESIDYAASGLHLEMFLPRCYRGSFDTYSVYFEDEELEKQFLEEVEKQF